LKVDYSTFMLEHHRAARGTHMTVDVPARFRHLLSPGRIGTMELRNRIVMCPMGDNQATAEGYVTEQQMAYFEARAAGGAALLLVGSVAASGPNGRISPMQSAASDDSYLPGLRELAQRVHAHGARVALQLSHGGKTAVMDVVHGYPMLVPSLPRPSDADPLMAMVTAAEAEVLGTPFAAKGARVEFREMTRDDIAACVQQYADAVDRARRAGIDGCELHAGHGYLIDQFLSPTTNFRTDEYGGSVENRARFLVEVLTAVRDRVGPDFPVWCRLNGRELLVDGETVEDACRVAELAEAAGADAIHVSAYADPALAIGYTEAHATHTPGRFLQFGAAVKQRVSVPVISVGRIEPDVAERVIADGMADFIAMGRKLIADPELPNKLREDRTEDIRPCMYHYRCIGQIFLSAGIKCASNAFAGREGELRIGTAPTTRHTLVVGGGPAGLETARLAALRGHRVTLLDASTHLGGRFRYAAMTDQPNADLLRWLVTQVGKLGVEVHLGRSVNADDIVACRADEVVIATGARWERPPVPGADLTHVYTVDGLDSLLDAGEVRSAGAHVVVIGGNRSGLSVAKMMRSRGCEVTVLESTPVFATSYGLPGRWRLVHEARSLGIELIPDSRPTSIDAKAVAFTGAAGERSARADLVIVTDGAQAVAPLVDELRSRGVAAQAVGDCREVALVEGAMLDAAKVAVGM
jgi:2,4-dienoyl-CoA reductase (NADPH2)